MAGILPRRGVTQAAATFNLWLQVILLAEASGLASPTIFSVFVKEDASCGSVVAAIARTVMVFLVAVGPAWGQTAAREAERTAGTYPVRPVRIIVGYAAGGTVDFIARGLAEELTQRLKQIVLVENRPGAGGSLASESAAKATPDGYTLYIGGLDSIVYSFLATGRKPLDPTKDFIPIAEVARNEFLVVAHNSLPANNIPELIALAKARPNSLLFASGGHGSTPHILGERFAVTAGVELMHVPYKQGLLPDLLAGRVHLIFAPAHSIRVPIANGKLKVLATLAPQRSPSAPDRPTLAETGFPGFWHIGLLHLYAPGAVPRGTISRLNREIRSILVGPAFQARLAGLGDEPGAAMSSDEAIAVLRERRAWMDEGFEIAVGAARTRQAGR
jgi:tripartite-type tricarboxylate transporter receptor subunit TctC